MRKINKILSISFAAAAAICGISACDKYLDVVPDDGIATIETAFNLRSTAIRYLGTCYSYMTNEGVPGSDYGMLTGDELWDLVGRVVTNTSARVPNTLFNIARGFQSATTVYGNDWASMYEGIRCCDILCDNISSVPDMEEWEINQWIAEAKFLKAYYHFNLIRKWGPVPVIRKSLPIDAGVEDVRVYREPIDSCFSYVIQLLDEAMPDLPLVNQSQDEYGRITKAACAGLKARVAAYAASPLFNGNEEEASLVDNRGVKLFPSKSDSEKLAMWKAAMDACKEALDVCEEAKLYLYDGLTITNQYRMSDSLKLDLTLRGAFCERWNSEVVWGNTQTSWSSMSVFQQLVMPNFTNYQHSLAGYKFIGVPLKIAEQFYTRNGLPIVNDESWQDLDPMKLRAGDPANSYYIRENYVTTQFHFDREPRFYSTLGFDGGLWLGCLANYNDLTPDEIYNVDCRIGGHLAKTGSETGPVTGYFPKKLIPYRCIVTNTNSFTGYYYAWPMIRLSDLFLLYAECINEYEGPKGEHSAELFEHIDAIRKRASIPDVKTAWDEFSNRPGYYDTKEGMRAIIHQERLNELCFESQRFWDLRRWKDAPSEYQKGIWGYNVVGATPEDYYVKTFIAEQSFGLKDYFWPIKTSDIEVNPNLVQNIGW